MHKIAERGIYFCEIKKGRGEKMYILQGFRKYELYNSFGQHVKTVYTPEEARDARLMYGYTIRVVTVDSIPSQEKKR
jgi:hypothetical protein